MKEVHRLLVAFGIGVIVTIASFPVDHSILEFMDWLNNPVLSYFFSRISFSLSLIFVLLIMTSLFMWEEHKKEWILPTWFSFAAALVITYVIKFIVARERPLDAIYFFGLPDYSFPSAHAAATFAVVPILDEEYPALKWFWILFAVLVAVSRIYLKVHFLTDVLAGILIGYAIGLGMLYLKDRHYFLR